MFNVAVPDAPTPLAAVRILLYCHSSGRSLD
jgi:hypothetical protein